MRTKAIIEVARQEIHRVIGDDALIEVSPQRMSIFEPCGAIRPRKMTRVDAQSVHAGKERGMLKWDGRRAALFRAIKQHALVMRKRDVPRRR